MWLFLWTVYGVLAAIQCFAYSFPSSSVNTIYYQKTQRNSYFLLILYLLLVMTTQLHYTIQFHHWTFSKHWNGRCQEIGLVAVMFFFELLFFYVSLAISFYVFFLNLFSIAHFLICWLPKTLKMKEKQDFNSFDYRNSLNIILWHKSLSRLLDWPLDPMVDL